MHSRFATVVLFLLAIHLLIGCSSAFVPPEPPATAAATPAPATEVVLQFARTGGFAGFDDEVTVLGDGMTIVQRRGQRTEQTTDQATVAQIRAACAAAVASTAPRRAVAEPAGADRISYVLVCAGEEFTTEDGVIAPELVPLIELINQLLVAR